MLNVESVKKIAFNEVSAAMMLDTQGNICETYRSYSTCVAFMSHSISIDAQNGLKISETTLEFILLSLKCLERLKDLAQTILKDDVLCNKYKVNTNQLVNTHNDENISTIYEIQSPITRAIERNKKILQNFEIRNKNLSHMESTSLRLSIERKMSENISLAEKQEKLILKKRVDSLNSIKYETFKNDEDKQFFIDVKLFESNKNWLQNLHKTKESEFSDKYFVENSIRLIMGSPSHPISVYLGKEKEKIFIDSYRSIEENKSIFSKDNISLHCNKVMSSLKNLYINVEYRFKMIFEPFKKEPANFLLHAFIEQYIFDDNVWTHIINLYRLDTQEMESKLSQIFRNNKNIKLEELGIIGAYALPNQSIPYEHVIKNIANILSIRLPSKKISHIVECMQQICTCYKEYCTTNNVDHLGIGADELVPILMYILIQSQSPQLITHIYALMDFLDEKNSIGEDGYCLTSFLTSFDSLLNTPNLINNL